MSALRCSDGYDGWNMNISRTFVFGWGIPFNHTGLRATYEFTDQLSLMGMIANNWEEAGVTDNNSEKTYGFQVGYNPIEKSAFCSTGQAATKVARLEISQTIVIGEISLISSSIFN